MALNDSHNASLKYRRVIELSSSDSSDDEILAPKVKDCQPSNKTRRKRTLVTDISDLPVDSCKIYTSEIDNFRSKFLNNLASSKDKILKERQNVQEESLFENEKIKPVIKDVAQPPVLEESSAIDEVAIEDDDISVSPMKKNQKPRRSTAKLIKSLRQASSKAAQSLSLDIDDCEVIPCAAESDNQQITVKIRCESSIERLPLSMNDPFGKILPSLSNILGQPQNKLYLSLNGSSVQANQTPKSIDLKIYDIIDCYILLGHSSSTELNDSNKIHLLLQAKNDKKKLKIACNRYEPLKIVLQEYGKMKDVDIERLSLRFDGEKVNLDETPADLDMEDSECIDVIIN